MIEVGQKVRFDPYRGLKFYGLADSTIVEGTVVEVHEKHKWFSVEYSEKLRTSFNFADIGRSVKVVG